MLKENLRPTAAVTDNDTSAAADLSRVDLYTVQVNISSSTTPTGNVKLQASLDNTNWVDISGATSAISADGTIMFHAADVGYELVRAWFDLTGGSYSAEVLISGKEREY